MSTKILGLLALIAAIGFTVLVILQVVELRTYKQGPETAPAAVAAAPAAEPAAETPAPAAAPAEAK